MYPMNQVKIEAVSKNPKKSERTLINKIIKAEEYFILKMIEMVEIIFWKNLNIKAK